MVKQDYEVGHATITDFFYWINERHRIYLQRREGHPFPWTEDKILQEYKFTNVFRELDRGTLALREMLKEHEHELGLLVFNVIWYRLFNLDTHAENPGWCDSFSQLEKVMLDKHLIGEQIFTGAHMTWAPEGADKVYHYLQVLAQVFKDKQKIAEMCQRVNSLKDVFNWIQLYKGVGPFIAYEIVCDFRFTPLLSRATDIFLWANIGPGCKRGLERLGLPVRTSSLRHLYELAVKDSEHTQEGIDILPDGSTRIGGSGAWLQSHLLQRHSQFCYEKNWVIPYPPFELREIEHSLCEFDKYQRVKTGAGRPRSRFIPPHLRRD